MGPTSFMSLLECLVRKEFPDPHVKTAPQSVCISCQITFFIAHFTTVTFVCFLSPTLSQHQNISSMKAGFLFTAVSSGPVTEPGPRQLLSPYGLDDSASPQHVTNTSMWLIPPLLQRHFLQDALPKLFTFTPTKPRLSHYLSIQST